MPGMTDMINFAIVVAGITISILGMVMTFRAEHMSRQIKTFFICMFSVIILYTLSDIISQISLVFLGSGYRKLSKYAVFFESLFSSLLMPMLTIYILKKCGKTLKSPLLYLVNIMWFIYFALLVWTQFTTLIYRVSEENVYERGPLYPLLLLPPVLLMVINIIGFYRRREHFNNREQQAFWVFLLLPVASMLIQMFSYGILFIVLGTSISAFIMFLFILDDQVEKSVNQKIEIGEQQLRIRTLQMRPHFIYNTMTNIYYLCETDPQKAKSIIGDFTKYLRNNFSAVVKQGLIPFNDELEHTRSYLAVVKARYENRIYTEYDTEYTSFCLPPLTLEPIVENAVKHGLDPELSPLHILIRTKKTEEGAEIIVENTGADIDPEEEIRIKSSEKEPHIGLENVADRLKSLCGGKLMMSPRRNGGVVVTMTIPEQKSL